MKLWLFWSQVPTVTRISPFLSYAILLSLCIESRIMSIDMWLCRSGRLEHNGCYVRGKHGGLSGSQNQEKQLQHIRRQLFLYLKPQVAEHFIGADILKDWCEGCALSHHFEVICLLCPSVMSVYLYIYSFIYSFHFIGWIALSAQSWFFKGVHYR